MIPYGVSGIINFRQSGRYGKSCEWRYSENLSKDFDWMEFNLSLSDRVLTGDRKAIAIDPENISKPGVVSGIPKISPDTDNRRQGTLQSHCSTLTHLLPLLTRQKKEETPFEGIM